MQAVYRYKPLAAGDGKDDIVTALWDALARVLVH
jgi:hypothetical protein